MSNARPNDVAICQSMTKTWENNLLFTFSASNYGSSGLAFLAARATLRLAAVLWCGFSKPAAREPPARSALQSTESLQHGIEAASVANGFVLKSTKQVKRTRSLPSSVLVYI